MNRLRRLAAPVGRLRSRGVAAARRRPRRAAAATIVVTSIAIIAVALAVVGRSGPPLTAVQGPNFTVRDGWTLAELERHIESGDVDAITASPAGDGTSQELLARTRSGQVVTVDLSVNAADAVSALSSLGYGHLLTTEAVGIARPASSSAAPPNVRRRS
jgi:predicted PurR-regulated permease PerM